MKRAGGPVTHVALRIKRAIPATIRIISVTKLPSLWSADAGIGSNTPMHEKVLIKCEFFENKEQIQPNTRGELK